MALQVILLADVSAHINAERPCSGDLGGGTRCANSYPPAATHRLCVLGRSVAAVGQHSNTTRGRARLRESNWRSAMGKVDPKVDEAIETLNMKDGPSRRRLLTGTGLVSATAAASALLTACSTSSSKAAKTGGGA